MQFRELIVISESSKLRIHARRLFIIFKTQQSSPEFTLFHIIPLDGTKMGFSQDLFKFCRPLTFPYIVWTVNKRLL